MGDVISASDRFKTQARESNSYAVRQVDHVEGYILLKLALIGRARTTLCACIPQSVFPNASDMRVGQIVRLECTKRLFKPKSGFMPHIILKSYEVMQGQLHDGHRNKFMACMVDDPNYPFDSTQVEQRPKP